MELDRAAFEALVEQALDEIPEEIASQVHNVVVLVEDDPPRGRAGSAGALRGRLSHRAHG